MTLGQSAGRSAKNPTRAEARRRFSDAERRAAVHPKDDPAAWPSDVKPGMFPIPRFVGHGAMVVLYVMGYITTFIWFKNTDLNIIAAVMLIAFSLVIVSRINDEIVITYKLAIAWRLDRQLRKRLQDDQG